MNHEDASLLIKSLIGRLRTDGAQLRLPDAVISAEELEALQVLSGDRKVVVSEISVPVPDSPLDQSVLSKDGPPEDQLRLCLDFGTAMSKAWATGNSSSETYPLVLGRVAGEGEQLALPSSVFFSKTGRIFLGAAAERQHRQEMDGNRERFDNLKRMLSEAEVGQELDDVPLSAAIDPTASGLTKGDILVLYLAWLTHCATESLQTAWADAHTDKAVDSCVRAARRRLAIPCFENATDEGGGVARGQWASAVLQRASVRAQVVADALKGKWDVLTVAEAKGVLRKARAVTAKAGSGLLCRTPSIREPVAAGASRFEEQLDKIEANSAPSSARRFLLVVDAGAGTTDFAVFEVWPPHNEAAGHRYSLLKNTVRMCRIAGNAVDAIIRPLAITACGVNPETGHPCSDEDFRWMKADLQAQVRNLKQVVFTNGTVDFSLRPNLRGRLTREQIEKAPAFRDLGRDLRAIRNGIFRDLFPEDFLNQVRRAGSALPIWVLLTGGSSALPIIRDLAEGTLGVGPANLSFKPIIGLPEWVTRLPRELAELVAANYPQCAVAIGGSAIELPEELSDLTAPIIPPPSGPRILPRFPTRGV